MTLSSWPSMGYSASMEIVFGLGLLGLLGAYFFLRGYVFMAKEVGQAWRGVGLVAGLVPVVQWIYALAHPQRCASPVASQVLGLLLMTPSAAVLWFVAQFFNGNFRIG